MHPILAKIDDLDETILRATDVPMMRRHSIYAAVHRLRQEVRALLTAPTSDDVERARQAQEQGDVDCGGYPPAAKERLKDAAYGSGPII